MRCFIWASALLCLGLGPAAWAQDAGQLGGVVAAGAETFGQALGAAASGGSNVVVTATGHAALSAPAAQTFAVDVQGQDASAVAAWKQHGQRLQALQGLAARYGVALELGSTTIRREVDVKAMRAAQARDLAAHARTPGASAPVPVFVPPMFDQGPQVFVVSTGVRFRASSEAQLPAFLDALGASDIEVAATGSTLTFAAASLLGSSEVLGFGDLGKTDEPAWDHAIDDAMAAARRQAHVLAAASGREVGEVRQVILLTRSIQGDQANVTLAVAYSFAPRPDK